MEIIVILGWLSIFCIIVGFFLIVYSAIGLNKYWQKQSLYHKKKQRFEAKFQKFIPAILGATMVSIGFVMLVIVAISSP